MFVIYSTFPSEEVARSITQKLVEESVAACGNIFPGHLALYKWEEKICEEKEVAVLFKAINYEMFEKRLCALHPYSCPCIVGCEVDHAHEAFRTWVQNCSRSSL